MQFSFEPGVALTGSITFLVIAVIVIVAVPWGSHVSYKDSVRWHQSDLKYARARLKEAPRRDRERAQKDLDHYLSNPPKRPSLKKRTFATIGVVLVAYLLIAMGVHSGTRTPYRIVDADTIHAYEAQYGVVDNHQYNVLQLEPFVSTTTEGSSILGTGSVDTYPISYVVVVYEYQGISHSVAVALSDVDITERAGADPTLEFEISDGYRNPRWAQVHREYEGCTEVMRWIWLTCDQELVSETLVIDDSAPSLGELVADGRVSVTMVMSHEQHREVLAGK